MWNYITIINQSTILNLYKKITDEYSIIIILIANNGPIIHHDKLKCLANNAKLKVKMLVNAIVLIYVF